MIIRNGPFLWIAMALVIAGLVTAGPSLMAGAASETFFADPSGGGSPCPSAHCDRHLDGIEHVQTAANYTPTVTTVYTPTPHVAYNIGLGCTSGKPAYGTDPAEYPQMVACAGTAPANSTDPANTPYLYSLTATSTTSPPSVSLTKNWNSAPYTGPQPACNQGVTEYAVTGTVIDGAPLISDYGYTYVSDNHSMVKYNELGDASGYGTCYWAATNPDEAALISWNAVYLPPNPNPPTQGGFPGGYYLVGQGAKGPVVLVSIVDASTVVTLPLTDTAGDWFVTHNTLSVVDNISRGSGSSTVAGARVYDSTQACPTGSPEGTICSGQAPLDGRLYAIDILSPNTSGGTPKLKPVWYYDFWGPSGASPMVMPGEDQVGQTSPLSDQIYFDGGSITSTTDMTHPTLFGLQDLCQLGANPDCVTNALTATQLFTHDFNTIDHEGGYCGPTYYGIAAAPALENPELDGSGSGHYSVWAHVACQPTLHRFDAQTGLPWTGSGASTISITQATGLNDYVAGSTMQTITDTVTGHVIAFMGINHSPLNAAYPSYLTALDLEQQSSANQLLWKVQAPYDSRYQDQNDTPFHGQFPIAKTKNGDYVLIAATAGADNGGSIMGLVLRGPS